MAKRPPTRKIKATEAQLELEEKILGKPGVPPENDNVVTLITDMNANGRRRVTVVKDHPLSFPELYLNVYIQGPKWEEAMFAEMFMRAGCTKARSIDEADLVVFCGGVDVDPRLYGEVPHPETNPPDVEREIDDIGVFIECVEAGVPMLGICRGAQFGHVMHKGKLYQDVDNHYGDHSMWDVRKEERIDCISSVHHQMVLSNKSNGMELIATSNESRERWRNPNDSERGPNPDIEAFFYRDTMFLGMQGHPEYSGYAAYTKWALDAINDYIICNPDIVWVGQNRRLSKEIRDQRKWTYNQRALDYLEEWTLNGKVK
jgi:gamma-glutamyl-gamma-aminobutyrate hydrolase PuuD